MQTRGLTRLVSVAVTALLAACNGSPPTAPSPVVALPPDSLVTASAASGPTLTCPADIARATAVDEPVQIRFQRPTVTSDEDAETNDEGTGPPDASGRVKALCVPAPGDLFPVGTTQVTCTDETVSPALSCAFTVTVAFVPPIPPRPSAFLSKTSFVAFGDSITEGFLPDAPPIVFNHIPPSTAYPSVLQVLLDDLYSQQTIVINRAAKGGESSNGGRRRLPFVLEEFRPEVLLLQEGVNQVVGNGPGSVANDLEAMVEDALAAGAEVLLANLIPVSDAREAVVPGEQAAIRAVNASIQQIAASHGIGPVVNLARAFDADPSLLSRDGKHPSIAGYRKMAELFAEQIVARYENLPIVPAMSQLTTDAQ